MRARASFVSMSSPSMFEMSTTMSSIGQNSYFCGSTLGGPASAFGRLAAAAAAWAAEPEAPASPDANGPSELLLLWGETSPREGPAAAGARAAADDDDDDDDGAGAGASGS